MNHAGSDLKISNYIALLQKFIIIFLFLMGIVHWFFFYNGTDLSFQVHDWHKEYTYYSILKQAILEHIIPYHFSGSIEGTNRFLGIPEVPTPPQMFLLAFMSINQFVFANTLILYSIGFAGLMSIKKKYNLSLIPFSFLFLLFNFNGFITSHIAVGHSVYISYFFLPFFFLYMFEIAEAESLFDTSLKLAVVLFFILIQGAFHMYVWCVLFMLLFLIFNLRYFKKVFSALIISVALLFFRLVPAALTFWNLEHKFIGGYPTIKALIQALVLIKGHTTPFIGTSRGLLGWWEYDIYIGFTGLAFIIYFGIILHFKENSQTKRCNFKAFDFPILLIAVLAMKNIYLCISSLSLLRSERVSSRLMIIPLLALIIISSIRLQFLLEEIKRAYPVVLLALTVVFFHIMFSLMNHSYVWRLGLLEEYYKDRSIDLSGHIILQKDFLYVLSVKVSAVVSLVAIVWLLFYWLRILLYRDHSVAKESI